MPPQLPGVNVSLLRQRTFARPSEPLTVSGRVTAFGLGLPALVRVFVEGPSHNPEVRTFDTVASPISGDYAVAVLAEKEGQYQVYAQAYPPLGLPVPGAAEPIAFGPPLAEWPRPPLVVGEPVDGRVEFEVAPGQRQRVTLPPPTPIEVVTPVTFAPQITVTPPRERAVAFPVPVTPPTGPPGPPAEVAIAEVVSGRITGFEVE